MNVAVSEHRQVTIYALAIGSNVEREHWIEFATRQLALLGDCEWSRIYEIPCRDGKGDDYYNVAALVYSDLSYLNFNLQLKNLEQQAGRVRPSHHIPLDIDIIAMGENIPQLQVVAKRLPLAFDVCLPLSELWAECPVSFEKKSFKILN